MSTIHRAAYCAEALEARRLLSAGDLDSTFGVGGYALPADQTHDYTVASVLVTPSGKTIVAGTREPFAQKHTPTQLYLEQLNNDGSIDSSFGSNGVAAIRVTNFGQTKQALLQSDGKIVIVAVVDQHADTIAVVRFNSDGTLDHSFNGTGELTFQFSGRPSYATGAVMTPANQLVIAANTKRVDRADQPAICRLNVDGSFDQTFASGGQLLFGTAVICNVLLRPDGRLVLGGQDSSGEFVFGQLHSDGSFDKKFANGGFGFFHLGHGRSFNPQATPAIALTSDGELLYAGTAEHGSTHGVILRVTTKGKIDKMFGDRGAVVIQDQVASIAVSKKQIYIASPQRTVYRMSLDGIASPSFGTKGVTQFYLPAPQESFSLISTISLAGGFITLGVELSNPNTAAAVRLLANGDLDPSLNSNGVGELQGAGAQGEFSQIATTPGGKIIAVGHSLTGGADASAIIEEFNGNGSLNTAFGEHGLVVIPGTVGATASAIVDSNSGKIDLLLDSGVVERLNSNGSIDQTWGKKGLAHIDWLGTYPATIANLELQPDGKLLAFGTVNTPNPRTPNFAIARFNTNGTLDTSFGQNGTVATSLDAGDIDGEIAKGLLASDGKILIVGTADVMSFSTVSLIRYNSNGSIDTTFGSNGRVVGGYDYANDAVILNSGQILVSVVTGLNSSGTADNKLVRYSANGSSHQEFSGSASHIALAADGSIYATDTDMPVVKKFSSQLVEDQSFDFAQSYINPLAIAIDANFDILVAGSEGVSPVVYRLQGN